MIKLNGQRNCLYLNGMFIKEAYIGNKQILGFTQSITPYNYTGDCLEYSGYNTDEGTFSSGGYMKFKAPCSQLNIGLVNIWDPGGSYSMIDVYIKDIHTGAQLYKYNISVSSYSSLSNFTLKGTLYDANNNQLASYSWKTDYGFGFSYTLFKYDFATNKWVFGFVSGSGTGSSQSHSISSKYKPCKIEIYNVSGRNNAKCIIRSATVQG